MLYKEEIGHAVVNLRLISDFIDMSDKLDFYYCTEQISIDGNEWKKVGDSHKMKFGLDHFTGARFGLCLYSEQQTGGTAAFSDFVYEVED